MAAADRKQPTTSPGCGKQTSRKGLQQQMQLTGLSAVFFGKSSKIAFEPGDYVLFFIRIFGFWAHPAPVGGTLDRPASKFISNNQLNQINRSRATMK
jgi:hypothetical protein